VNGDIEPKLGTAWWTRLPDGGMRRVWVSHADGQFHCCRELSSAEQEVARVRLETYARDGGDPGSFLEDVRLAAQAQYDTLRTVDLQQAFDFLGGDSAARRALLASVPTLDVRRLRAARTDADVTGS
jgi:hypothetical protein